MAGSFYQLAPIVINGTTLAGIRSLGYNKNVGKYLSRTDGKVSAVMATALQYAPRVNLTTEAIAAALTLMGLSTDIPFVALSAGGAVWQTRKVQASSPVFATGSTAENGTMALGTFVLDGIEAPANSPATLSASIHGYGATGATDPVVFAAATAVADPTVVPGYILDSVTVDSTSIDEIVSVSLASSYDIELGHGMAPFPVMARIGNVGWVMTIRHNLATIPRSKVDKDSSASFVLKNLVVGGPTRGASTVTASVTGFVSTESAELSASSNSAYVTTITGRSVAGAIPCTIALA